MLVTMLARWMGCGIGYRGWLRVGVVILLAVVLDLLIVCTSIALALLTSGEGQIGPVFRIQGRVHAGVTHLHTPQGRNIEQCVIWRQRQSAKRMHGPCGRRPQEQAVSAADSL